MGQMSYQNLKVSTHDKVGLIVLNRPQALNALSLEMRAEIMTALDELEHDPTISVMVITGSDKAFAAGADIKAMRDWTFNEVLTDPSWARLWDRVGQLRKPLVAAVAGFALGGGCELAMACDFILAADNAKFGQPEVKVGVIPGGGGTQRLARSIGKSKAMEMVLTGRMIEADEAERCGLVSRVVPLANLVDEALATAARIAELSQPVIGLARDAVNRAFETPLNEGLHYERRLFQATFATEDRREGMTAFIEKRKPEFKNR